MWPCDCGSEIYLMPLPTNKIAAATVQVLSESPSKISNKFLTWLQCLENTGQGNAHVYIFREVSAQQHLEQAGITWRTDSVKYNFFCSLTLQNFKRKTKSAVWQLVRTERLLCIVNNAQQ